MGYMRHHAIVVTSWSEERLQAAHKRAEELLPGLVTPILKGWVNEYQSFFVGPDGSKEGWDDSDKGDIQRQKFREYLASEFMEDGGSYVDWAEVQYGDDEEVTEIVDSSDDRCSAQRTTGE
jgi:hypothetical protein